MLRVLKRLAVLLVLLFCALAGAAATQSASQREVLAALHDWLDALAKNDLPRVERIVADDYRITVADGRVLDKTEDLEPLRSGKVKFRSAEATDVDVRVFGTTAIVTGVARFTADVGGNAASFQERFTDVYVKRRGRWQPVASHTTPVKPPT